MKLSAKICQKMLRFLVFTPWLFFKSPMRYLRFKRLGNMVFLMLQYLFDKTKDNFGHAHEDKTFQH